MCEVTERLNDMVPWGLTLNSKLDVCISSGRECGAWTHDRPCKTSRVTWSMVPFEWQTQASFSGILTGPLGDEFCRFAESGGVDCDSNLPCYKHTTACVFNLRSASWLPCEVIGRCFTFAEIQGTLSTMRPIEVTRNGIKSVDGESHVIRAPPNLNIKVRIFGDTKCQGSLQGEWTSTDTDKTFVFLDTPSQFGSVKFDYATAADEFCGCRQPPQPGGIPRGGVSRAEGTQVGLCETCNAAQFLKNINPCVNALRECSYCPVNQVRAQSDVNNCQNCAASTPYRPNTPAVLLCRDCTIKEFWRPVSFTFPVSFGCVALDSIIVTIQGTVTQPFDRFRNQDNREMNEVVPAGQYRTDTYALNFCGVRAQDKCDSNIMFEFLHGCTGNLQNTVGQFYVNAKNDNNVIATILWEDYLLLAGVRQSVEVLREGKCSPCNSGEKCKNGEYLSGCLRTNPETFAISIGFSLSGSVTENQGECRTCMPAVAPTADEYTSHRQQNIIQCQGWDDGIVVTLPLVKEQCRRVQQKPPENDRILAAGCGKQAFLWWSDTAVDTVQEVLGGVAGSRNVPAPRLCSFGDTNNDACNIPGGAVIVTGGRPVQTRVPLTWTSSADKTAEVRFCPPGWFVDLTVEGCANAVTWLARCCRLCVDCIYENREKRTADWVTCSGSRTEDTEQRCQQTCDLGYYEELDIQGNTSRCRQCELC